MLTRRRDAIYRKACEIHAIRGAIARYSAAETTKYRPTARSGGDFSIFDNIRELWSRAAGVRGVPDSAVREHASAAVGSAVGAAAMPLGWGVFAKFSEMFNG